MGLSSAQWYLALRQQHRRLVASLGASDRLVPTQSPGTRQRPRPDAEIGGGKVSFPSLPLRSVYSITSSARASNIGDTVRPIAFAAIRLIASSNLVGCSTGKSPGFAPRRILCLP